MSKVQAESLGNKSRNKYLFIAALLYCGFNFQQRVYPQFVAAILLRLLLVGSFLLEIFRNSFALRAT
jgi:hypothetical protein